MQLEWQRHAHQSPDILQVRLSKVGNDIIKILKGQGFTPRHGDGQGGAQLEVTPYPSCLLATFPDVLMHEHLVAILASVQLHCTVITINAGARLQCAQQQSSNRALSIVRACVRHADSAVQPAWWLTESDQHTCGYNHPYTCVTQTVQE